MKLPKAYEAALYEKDMYLLWEEAGAFQPSDNKHAENYSIIMPPPNATGSLHVGHVLGLAIQDTLIRYQRMSGKNTLYLPGTDHAAIAVNAVMEKDLASRGTSRDEVGREEFVRLTQDFIVKSQDNMRGQIRAMGASCDWTRERYTLDPGISRIVQEVFIKMYRDGLIYRGDRIVNWDPKLVTTVSDDEVEHQEEVTTFYTFQYGPFQISTARPETKFGDKYVVVHPEDERYKQYEDGYQFEAEWINGKVTATLIKDDVIDMSFGTGAMTITPWHDQTDFEIAERHNLDKEQIIDYDGKLLPIAGEFAGMTIAEARPKIIEKLRDKGLVVGEDANYHHSVAINYRGKGVLEPQIKRQWFVDVNKQAVDWKGKKRSLKEVLQTVIKDEDITILPERFNTTYFHWIDNLRDWCISRQIWWGHRIPVWYSRTEPDTEPYVGIAPPDDEQNWEQDPDTLDTWFSSALWTWSTLADPEKSLDLSLSLEELLDQSPDFERFHPTTVMESGYDILFFWMARMILATTYAVKQIPFKTIYLHGMVQDKNGAKMSKSHPETAIDPLDIVPRYGADALRLALMNGLAPGSNTRIYEEKIVAQRNFCNKLWNIARFIEDKVGTGAADRTSAKPVTDADHWILAKFDQATQDISKNIDAFNLAGAYDIVYHLIWDELADWYLEASKSSTSSAMLAYVLEVALKLAHPFAPFVTETIWQTLAWEQNSLLISSEWPTVQKYDHEKANRFTMAKNIIAEIRHIQSSLSTSNHTLYYIDNGEFLEDNKALIIRMSRIADIRKVSDGRGLHLLSTPSRSWLDIEQELAMHYVEKLRQELEVQTATLSRLKGRLGNTDYVKNAPHDVVQDTRQSLASTEAHIHRLTEEIERFSNE